MFAFLFVILGGGFILMGANQSTTEVRSRAAYPIQTIPTPRGQCSIAGEDSTYGCCKGFQPKGDGTCKVAQCGKEGESAMYGCCDQLVPVDPCLGELECEQVCQRSNTQKDGLCKETREHLCVCDRGTTKTCIKNICTCK